MATGQAIPGFYWDDERRKYFRIESARTAPADAAWAEDNVKRRKRDREEAKAAEDERAKRADRPKPVRRSKLLQELMVGGLYQRQFGSVNSRELATAAFATSLRDKGAIPGLRQASLMSGGHINCLYVNGQDTRTGMGVMYMNDGSDNIQSYYIPRDENDQILGITTKRYRLTSQNNWTDQVSTMYCSEIPGFDAPGISSIKYREASHHLLITSRDIASMDIGLQLIKPVLNHQADNRYDTPLWRLDQASVHRFSGGHLRGALSASCVFTSAPAPAASSGTFCMLGTTSGVIRVGHAGDYDLDFLGGWPQQPYNASTTGPLAGTAAAAGAGIHGSRMRQILPQQTVVALDFCAGHPDVVLAGGRPHHVWVGDLRDPAVWTGCVGTGACTSHVRSVGEHQVLAAGIPHHLALHDMRSPKQPVFHFDGYQNAAHLMEIGFDASPSPFPGLVAAAHDDGTVALYSLRTGARLASPPAIDHIRVGGPVRGGPRNGRGSLHGGGGVVKALTFATLPGDRNASLFIAQKERVHKYSFAAGLNEDRLGEDHLPREPTPSPLFY